MEILSPWQESWCEGQRKDQESQVIKTFFSINMGKVRSLANKVDELTALVRLQSALLHGDMA